MTKYAILCITNGNIVRINGHHTELFLNKESAEAELRYIMSVIGQFINNDESIFEIIEVKND